MAITTAKALRHAIDQQRHLAQLRLELGEASDLGSLTHEIRRLRSARRIVISSEEVFANMSEPDWMSHDAHELFAALGKLRGVEEIQLNDLGVCFGPHGARFPVLHLTRLLKARRQRNSASNQQQQQKEELCHCEPSLKRLVLSVRLHGDAERFRELAECLQFQRSLKRVAWEEWCFPTTDEGDDEEAFDFNTICSSLACLPKLESLSIRAMTAGSRRANLGSLGTEAVVQLCRSCSLKQLQLVHFQLSNKTARAMADILRHENNTLEILSLDLSRTGATGASRLFEMLRYNKNLTEFQIWASTMRSWATHKCLTQLARDLKENSSLLSLVVLTHSRTLQEAMQNVAVVDDRVARAFVRTLEANCTLETMVLDDFGDDDRSSKLASLMKFYLALNGSKRRQHLLQEYDTYTRKDWVELLNMAMKSDRETRLEALYYFLRLNPSLCQF